MRNSFVLLTTLAVVIFLCGCNRNSVDLDYTNAKDEVPQLGNLTFRFNKSIVPDSLLSQWDSTEYVKFEPAIAGRFRWERPDELVFSPSRPLPPATSFKAILNDKIVRHSKFSGISKGKDIAFHTPDLQLQGVNPIWVLADDNGKIAIPQIDLSFNYPVDPNKLKEKLQVEVDGKIASFVMQTLSASDRISVRLIGIKAEDKDYETRIMVAKGLVPEGGTNGTAEADELRSAISSPYVLTINGISSEMDGGSSSENSSDKTVVQTKGSSGRIYIRTSQQLSDPDPSAFVKIEPAVKFTTQVTDEGFTVSSDYFDTDKSYRITILKGLRGKIGGVLRNPYEESLAFGALEPGIHFASKKSVYLSAQGARNIEVRITSLEKVKLIISKVYESNLLLAERYGYEPSQSYEGEERSYNETTLGDVIYEKEIETSSLPKYGNSRLLNFNVADKLPEFKGIYHVSIRSTKEYWVSDSRFISLSDIGLIAKEGKDKMFVFANSIKTANPLTGVNVLVYGYNNQLIGTASTNNDGVAEVAYLRKEYKGFRPAMVIAKTADDFNYLPFNSTQTGTSRFDVGGKSSNTTGLDAFIYAERDIYRPGETVHFAVILRTDKWQTPGDIPVKMKFIMPTGKELTSFRKTLNEQGGVEGSVAVAASAITGSYTLEVYSSNDVLMGTKSFKIEEFVPDRIKVTATLNKADYNPGETAVLNIHAVNFFGPPAANRNYEAEIQVKQKTFNPAKFTDYNFGLANQTSFFDKIVKEGKTDANGDANQMYEIPATYKNIGVLQTTFYSTVFDETGRPVSRSANATVFTQDVFFGVGSDGYGYYPLFQPVKFPLVAVNKSEQQLNGVKAEVQVIKHEYRTVLAKQGSYFRYDSQKEDKLLSKSIVDVSGKSTEYSFVPKTPGDYELRISIPGAASYVSRSFYSYGSYGGDNNSFEVSTEGNIDISLDKAGYMAGDKAKILFKTPFSGKMLVTMETDKVLSYQYLNVDKRTASLEMPLTAAYLPNVYVTATLVKPHDVSSIPLTVAHGFQNITVEEKNRQMAVSIVAPKAIRSGIKQRVTVKASAGSFITLAAVDNGVLQVSDFKTPDPYHYFYARKALEVFGYDMYPLLFPEIRSRLSSTGGDADLEMSKRTNPMPNKRIKIVSYWSGITKANGSGEAKFDIDIPAFSGQIRLMAVAYDGASFGSAEQPMTVADPLVLSSTIPRFASPGDTLMMPVSISNTTAKSGNAVATVRTTGPLTVIGESKQTVSLTPNGETRMTFKIAALPTVNAGKIIVEVQGLGEKFTQETDLTVRPASTLQKMTGSDVVSGAATRLLNTGSTDFLPGSGSYQLVVSRSPAIELGSQLSYLLQYPYGCTEQVISSVFPQLYFNDLSALFNKDAVADNNLNRNIQEAIRKIAMRQTYNGGIMLWDNESTQSWWTTAYAAQFLLEAKKAGYDFDRSLLETALAYLNNRLKTKESITYYFNRTQQKKIAPKEVAYTLYVLASAGRPNVSVMNYYKSKPEMLSLDSRYLLSAAYALAGDKKGFHDMLPSSFSGEESVAQTGGSFYSDIRDEAISLNVLIDVDPSNSQIPLMAKHVVDKLKQRSWYSTQESAFSFLALGKLARSAAKSDAVAEISLNGKVIGKADATPFRYKTTSTGKVDLVTKGSGRLYYWWQQEGISVSGRYKEEDNFIKVRRRFFDRFGQPVNTATFAQNSLVIVQITVEKTFSGRLENVVVTDLLPAGFEIENPRTKELPGMDWIKDAATPTQLDVRDDRINLFVDLYNTRQVYYYAVRAVSPGVFHMGPVSADAMYNGEYHSYNGAMTVRIN
ncbi:MAG: alpha-2-macroglobulin [Chitinophagaceae bacterium]